MRGWAGRAVALGVSTFCFHGLATSQPVATGQNTKTGTFEWATAPLNDNTTTIISGDPRGTDVILAHDMSGVLNSRELRILPVVGQGAGQNVLDILRLKGIDMGITQTDVLKYFLKNNMAGANIADRLTYVTKLYNEEVHLVADRRISDVKDLAGKTVNFGEVGSGSDVSGRLIFEALGIRVNATNVTQAEALFLIKRGQVAATVVVDGEPTSFLSDVKRSDGLHLLAIDYTPALREDYLPTALTSEQYPNLIEPGASIDTVAVGAVLAAFNWPKQSERYQRVATFVSALFDKHAEFQKQPHHRKWQEVNLAAKVIGWKRFPAAQEWLDGGGQQSTPSVVDASGRVSVSPDDPLYREFLQWKRSRGKSVH
jgi:uncharacterized protein